MENGTESPEKIENVSRETNSTPAEPTATEKVINSYKQMYEQEHELRLQKEREADELARIMTNMSIQTTPQPPKKKSLNELVDDLFGGGQNGKI